MQYIGLGYGVALDCSRSERDEGSYFAEFPLFRRIDYYREMIDMQVNIAIGQFVADLRWCDSVCATPPITQDPLLGVNQIPGNFIAV